MNTVKINKIHKEAFCGKVYNLHLESKDDNPENDDLFWVEQSTGIVTHNCFPKDVSAICRHAKNLGYDPKLIQEILNSNERIGELRKSRRKD